MTTLVALKEQFIKKLQEGDWPKQVIELEDEVERLKERIAPLEPKIVKKE